MTNAEMGRRGDAEINYIKDLLFNLWAWARTRGHKLCG